MRIKNLPRQRTSKRQGKLARYVTAGLKPPGAIVDVDPEPEQPKKATLIRAEGPIHSAPPDLRQCLYALAPPLGKTALILSERAPQPAQLWPDEHWLGRRPRLRGGPLVKTPELARLMQNALEDFSREKPDYVFPASTQDALLAGAVSFEAAWRYAAVLKARVYVASAMAAPHQDTDEYDSG